VLDAALATDDDGLVDLAAASTVKLLVLLPLKSTDGLYALPRPGVLGHGLRAVEERAHLCGAAAMVEVGLFGWLQAATMVIDADRDLAGIFKSLHNFALAAKALGARPQDNQLVALASVTGEPYHYFFDQYLGRSRNQTIGSRKLLVWKTGRGGDPIGVATPSVDAKSTVYGLVWGGEATMTWWWGQPSPASAGGSTAYVALARTDVPWLLKWLGPEMGMPGLDELAPGLGEAKALLTLSADALTGTLGIEVK
jgi:hypothetical protein